MRYFYILMLVISVLMSAANAVAQDPMPENTVISQDLGNRDLDPSDIEMDEEEYSDEEEEMTDVQARLWKAQEEERLAATQRPPEPQETESGLNAEQKEKLAGDNQVMETKQAPAVVKKTSSSNKYTRPKHDWSFKNKTSQTTGRDPYAIPSNKY